MILRLFSIFMIIVLFPISVIADEKNNLSMEDREKIQTVSLELAQCSGVYSAVAEIHEMTDAPALAQQTRETANGAEIASAWLISSMGVIKDWQNALKYAEGTASSEKLRWKAMFEKPTDPNEIISQLTDEMKKCNLLGDFQAELVQEARLWAYSHQPAKSK